MPRKGSAPIFRIVGANAPVPPTEFVEMGVDNSGTAVGSTQNLLSFSASAILDQTVVSTPIGVTSLNTVTSANSLEVILQEQLPALPPHIHHMQ